MHLFYLLSLFFSLFCMSSGIASEQDKGTLIVSYSTGERGERLNRVRFSLISEDSSEQIYPKGNAFVEGTDRQSRLIAIENLPVGNYRLRFLVPNSDKLFGSIPEKEVAIVKDKVVRIDQMLHPHYSTLKVKTDLLPEDFPAESHPRINLKDHQGNTIAHSTTGKLIAHFLVPGTYTLKFEPLIGYRTPESLSLNITAGHTIGPLLGTYIWEGIDPSKNDSQAISDAAVIRRPSGTVIINQINAQLTVNNSLPKAHWTLLKNDIPVYQGLGSVVNYQTADGDNYRIVPEEIEGYIVRVSPSSTFSLYPAQTLNASIVYERSFGSLAIQAPFPDGETLTFTLKSQDLPPATFKIKSKGGKIFWQSQPLPTGVYEVSYALPPNYAAIPSDRIFIKRGERLQLIPQLFSKGALHVVANVPEAVFLLRTPNGSKVWKGEGREYTFTDIPPGNYILSFSTQDPDYFIPPKEMKVALNEKDGKEIKVTFQISSKLTIRTNIDRSHVIIQELGGEQKSYQENILNHSRVFNLPEGRYRVTLSSLPEDSGATANLLPPDPVEVTLKPLNSEDLNISFRINNLSNEKQRRLHVMSGISNAGYSIYKLYEGGRELVGHYSGKNTQITLPSAEHYEIIYDAVPNYETPTSTTIDVRAGEEKILQSTYIPLYR